MEKNGQGFMNLLYEKPLTMIYLFPTKSKTGSLLKPGSGH